MIKFLFVCSISLMELICLPMPFLKAEFWTAQIINSTTLQHSASFAMEFLPNEISVFICKFKLIGSCYFTWTPNISLKSYYFRKIYNIIILTVMIICNLSSFCLVMAKLFNKSKVYTFIEELIKLEYYLQAFFASYALYHLSRTGQLQL